MQKKIPKTKGSLASPADERADKFSPRYLWLHDCLLKDIQTGKYPVGSPFPTEEQLANDYQVSRHTVREATRGLVQSGLISRRRSTGTIVTATQQENKPYVAALGSLKELMDYTYTTRLSLFGQEDVTVNEHLAKHLGCEPDSKWLMLHTHRHLLQKAEPISYTQVYLRPEYAQIAESLKGQHTSIFNLHATLFDTPVDSVIQRIEASRMPAVAARKLGLSPTAPTLRMTRIYLDAKERVMSASLNFYISERFELVTHWRRGHDNSL
jgi:GntR family transcriptional regulator